MRSGRWIAAVLIVAACGSPMDDANAVIDAVIERHEVLNEDLIAEAQGIRERQMEHEVCRQVPGTEPVWWGMRGEVALSPEDTLIARNLFQRQRAAARRCAMAFAEISRLINDVSNMARTVDPDVARADAVNVRRRLAVSDPDRIAQALEAADTLLERFEGLLLVLDPTIVLRADGGVLARNFEDYEGARSEREEATDASLAELEAALAEYNETGSELLRMREAALVR